MRLALAGAEVVMKEDVCASSTSSPSESSKKFFPDFFSHLRDRVLKQLVKNLVFTFEFFLREKCAVLRVAGLYWYTCTAMFSSCAISLLV